MTAANLDFRDRAAAFAALEGETFDVLVIGGGITGCGIARDAAQRGLRVALVEARDIASGTSSRSSKLVHGGMRYLAQGDVAVVREAANERRILRRIAPHLAQRLPFVLPARSAVGLKTLQTAMWMYEKLGNVDAGERHEVWDAERLRAEEPAVVADRLAGVVVYPEYLTDDARLTVANARSAAAAGAVVSSYAAVNSIILDGGVACGAEVRDALTDETGGATVRARIVVNASGPWVDAIRRLEDRDATGKLQLTKGIHVVVPRERLPISRALTMQTPDKRGIFAVPRGRFVYLGTTDTFYSEAVYWPTISTDDIQYLLSATARAFTVPPLTPADVVAVWAGVRPLLGEPGRKPSEISRRNEVLEGPGGVLSIAGGKLTAYRCMAERVVDTCEPRLGRQPTACRTAEEPLPGGDVAGCLADLRPRLQALGLGTDEAERAARLYGAEALEVCAAGGGPAAEAAHAVQCEGAVTLEDYWIRRSARARFDDDGGMAALAPAAEAMASLLGWTDEERDRQIAACRLCRSQEMAVVRQG